MTRELPLMGITEKAKPRDGAIRVIRVKGCRGCPYSQLYTVHGYCSRERSREHDDGYISFASDDKIIDPPKWCPLEMMPDWLEPFPKGDAVELNEVEK